MLKLGANRASFFSCGCYQFRDLSPRREAFGSLRFDLVGVKGCNALYLNSGQIGRGRKVEES